MMNNLSPKLSQALKLLAAALAGVVGGLAVEPEAAECPPCPEVAPAVEPVVAPVVVPPPAP